MKKIYGYLKSSNQQPITQLQSDQEEFLQLTNQLIKYNQNITQINVDQIIDVIKQLTHYAIKGDNELHKLLFELFMEKDILLRVYSILQKPSTPPILIQAIFESVSSLLLNIREVTNRNYLLSHMSISNMVLWKTPFEQTKPNIELIETYISFLNLLAVRLDDISSMFFLNIKYPQFPLLWNAIRFFNHPELMVRNKSRSIVLHILNIKNQNILAYANSFPFIYYYYNLGNQLITTMRQANTLVEQIKWEFNLQYFQQLQSLSEELSEQLQYISDLISNNQQFSQLILDFVLQRPIIFVSQVIKYGYQNLDIGIAIQMLYLFIKIGKGKLLQYIYTVFLMDDRQKITIVDQPWEYFNPLDLDQNFLIKQSRTVFDTLQPIDIMDLKHENIDIRLCLQNLRQVDCVVSQDMNQKELEEQSLSCVNKIFSHLTNKDVIIYILLIMRHFKLQKNFLVYRQDFFQLFLNPDSQLIVKLLLADILIEVNDIEQKQIVVDIHNEIITQIIKIISSFQIFMDQLFDILKKYELNYFRKLINISQEFLLTEQINIQDPQHTLLFDPYSSLPNLLKLQYNIILSQHQIFQEFPKIQEQLPELTKLKTDLYQIKDKADCKMIGCQYSETGHFYDMKKQYQLIINSYILQIHHFLHIVEIDETNIITDVICSKLWQLLEVYGIERVEVLQFTYFDNSKFYIKFQNFDDINLINSIKSEQQQQFSDWYQELLITKLKSQIINNIY